MTTLEPSNDRSPAAGANRPDQAETAPLVLCHTCSAEARDRDRFCRRCGANLAAAPSGAAIAPAEAGLLIASPGPSPSTSPYGTSPLTQTAINHRVSGHRVSGTLLATITNGVPANLAAYSLNRVARRVIIALISIPIWLLIILLSPLDAYFAARAIAKQS